MLVRRNLSQGDIIKWKTDMKGEGSNRFVKIRDLMVVKVYSHHVLTIDIEEPHNKFCIQNVDLWMNGYISNKDVIIKKQKEDYRRFKDMVVY